MALVAYSDDSDLGSDLEDAEEVPKGVTNGKGETESQGESSSELRTDTNPKIDSKSDGDRTSENAGGIDSIVDFEDDAPSERKTGLLAAIPSAKPIDSVMQNATPIGAEEDELTDVPTVDTWKVTQQIKQDGKAAHEKTSSSTSGFTKKKEKRKVQFIVPSLSEFLEEDDEEEEEKDLPERKKVKRSSVGTGLFSVLPEPKNLAVKEAKRSLMPHVLTKRPVKQPAKPPKKAPLKRNEVETGNDSDEEVGSTDFFSLSDSLPSASDVGKAASVSSAPDVEPLTFTPSAPSKPLPEERMEEPEVSTPIYASNVPNYEHGEGYGVQPAYEQEYSAPQTTGIDQEAMLRLTGKRRGKGEAINFIDVSADDALLTRDEWMTKALTEEKPTQSFSKKREGMPSQRTKQKHQITYLAHQAKERELELKNNWAQNRMTKMQTQAKYGF